MNRRDRNTLLIVAVFAAAGTTVAVTVGAWSELLAGWSGLTAGLFAWYLRRR